VAAKQQLFKRFQLLEPGPKVGKGRDVQFGVLRANGKVVLFMDADLATPLHHLEEFYTAIQQGNDVVVGIRNQFTRRPSAIRRTISNLGNSLFSLASGVGFEDTQCGFKIFTNHAAKLCFSKWFDIEVLVIAQVNGLHISSLPLSDWIVKPYSTFEENDLSIVGSYVRDVFRITMNRLRGAYAEKSLNS
jgi:dolichyl-phosphate beta-glucosyltransferase